MIPNFIVARSPLGLRQLMLRTNAKSGAFLKWFDIQFTNGKWIAWYYSEVTAFDPLFKEPDQKVETL